MCCDNTYAGLEYAAAFGHELQKSKGVLSAGKGYKDTVTGSE